MKSDPREVEAFLQELDRKSRETRAKVRAMLQHRPDLLADYDRQMKELDNGIAGAKGCWHALSNAQRRVLIAMGEGRDLRRSIDNPGMYDACGRGCVLNVCRLPTARRLCEHRLIHVNGGATDPEAEFVLTERGAFVLRWGAIE